jgi:hypothetical protein
MTTSTTESEQDDEYLVDWGRARAMIEHEDELIHQRMTWLITINAFLFTAFFFSQKSDNSAGIKAIAAYLSYVIPTIGFLVSLSVLKALVAAMNQLSYVARWWSLRKATDPRNLKASSDDSLNLRHPQIVGFAKGPISHDLVITRVLPGIVMAAWVAILGAISAPLLLEKIPAWAAVVLVALSSFASFVFALRGNREQQRMGQEFKQQA